MRLVATLVPSQVILRSALMMGCMFPMLLLMLFIASRQPMSPPSLSTSSPVTRRMSPTRVQRVAFGLRSCLILIPHLQVVADWINVMAPQGYELLTPEEPAEVLPVRMPDTLIFWGDR